MSSTSKAMNFNDVKIDHIIIPPLQTKDKRRTCNPMYDNPETKTQHVLSIQTPPMRLPFGLSAMDGDGGRTSYSINGSFDNYKTDPLMKSFHNFCSNVQDFMIHTAAHNSEAWFGEKATPEMCRMMMNRMIKVSKDKEKAEKYDPTIKFTVRPKKEGGFWAKCIGPDGADMDIEKIQNGSIGSMKVKLTSVYLINGKFGVTWDLEWVKITQASAGGEFDYDESMYASEIASIPPMYSDATTTSNNNEEDGDALTPASPTDPAKKRERDDEGGDVKVEAEKKPKSVKKTKKSGP